MNTQITLDRLGQLKLRGMAEAYQAVLTMPVQDQPDINQLMARMAEAELLYRNKQRTDMLFKLSRLRYDAIFENITCNERRNLSKEKLLAISDCGFINRAENIIITGATGCGKSFLACAIGRQACGFGYKTMYLGMNRFLEKVALAKIEGSYVKLLNQIERTSLIILDDFGLHPLDTTSRLALLQILEDRYGKKAMIIASQLPVAKWYDYIGDSTIADAVLDRLSVNAHRFELKGESLRKKK